MATMKAELMTFKTNIMLFMAIIAAGAVGACGFLAAGGTSLIAVVGGFITATLALSLRYVWVVKAQHAGLQSLFADLQGEVTDIKERQAQYDLKMAEVERRTIESPALVWRAATADIEVLGSLVSDLAKSVGEHELKLTGFTAPDISTRAVAYDVPTSSSQTAPDWFEDDAELGFTADSSSPVPDVTSYFEASEKVVSQPVFLAPSPSVMKELKTTLATALASERLELCLQPIVMLPQRKTKGYEATLRLKGENGDLQSDTELRRIAAATGLEAESDRVLVERAVQVLRVLRARNREVSICCAVSANALADSGFRSAIESLVRSDGKLAKAITLEIRDADFRAKLPQTREAMATLGRLGVGIGVTDIHNLRFDISDMAACGIRQIRVPVHLMRDGGDGNAAPDIHASDMAELLQRKGIDLLVSDITSEQSVLDLLDQAVPLAQGVVFGASRPVRPEVLEPKVVADSAKKSTDDLPLERNAQQRTSAEGNNAGKTSANGRSRQSFRSLLRRA
jgi:cyclic-di-GMP phosphodiesterase, flagellum assembly factor TipF